MIKKVAVFNDLSGFGKCSLTAAIPVLSVLGVQCNPIPTMVLTGQGGFKVASRKDLTEMLPDYTYAWRKNGACFDGIYSGYLTCPKQIEYVMDFLKVFRKKHTFLLVDPVMGDNGRTYNIYSKELLEGMKELSRQANLITPNLTEACLLSDTPLEEVFYLFSKKELLEKVSQIAYKLRDASVTRQDVIITGVKVQEDNDWFIYNVALTPNGICFYASEWFNQSFSGTGDLFASAMCGLRVNGYSTEEALPIAGDFLHHSIADTFEPMITDIQTPTSASSTKHLRLETDNNSYQDNLKKTSSNNITSNNHYINGNDGVTFEKHLKELIVYAKY